MMPTHIFVFAKLVLGVRAVHDLCYGAIIKDRLLWWFVLWYLELLVLSLTLIICVSGRLLHKRNNPHAVLNTRTWILKSCSTIMPSLFIYVDCCSHLYTATANGQFDRGTLRSICGTILTCNILRPLWTAIHYNYYSRVNR